MCHCWWILDLWRHLSTGSINVDLFPRATTVWTTGSKNLNNFFSIEACMHAWRYLRLGWRHTLPVGNCYNDNIVIETCHSQTFSRILHTNKIVGIIYVKCYIFSECSIIFETICNRANMVLAVPSWVSYVHDKGVKIMLIWWKLQGFLRLTVLYRCRSCNRMPVIEISIEC